MALASTAQRLDAIDVDAAPIGGLLSALDDLRVLRGSASALEARIARRLAELRAAGEAPPVSDTLTRSKRSSRREAEKAERRADALGSAPDVERHLTTGRISDEHVDALANAASKLDDGRRDELFDLQHELADRACSTTPAGFARHLGTVIDQLDADAGLRRSERQRARATLSYGVDDETGMGWIRGEFHPDDFQQIKRRLDAEIVALAKRPGEIGRRDQLAARALTSLVTGGRATSTPPPKVGVLIDLPTLVNGLHESSIVEYSDCTPLPVETVRRHACTADIIPIVLDSDGVPVDVGRSARLATPGQRQALRAMYRTCAIEGCDADFDRCEIHHVDEWENLRGPTDLDNLLPLCSHHHHRCHEGRWRLQLDASSRQLTVFLPDGTEHSSCLPDLLAERRVA